MHSVRLELLLLVEPSQVYCIRERQKLWQARKALPSLSSAHCQSLVLARIKHLACAQRVKAKSLFVTKPCSARCCACHPVHFLTDAWMENWQLTCTLQNHRLTRSIAICVPLPLRNLRLLRHTGKGGNVCNQGLEARLGRRPHSSGQHAKLASGQHARQCLTFIAATVTIALIINLI